MRILNILFFLLIASISNAQERTITGTVIGAEDGLEMIGATIMVKGTSTGTITDFMGAYELEVPANFDTLTFSYTGYKSIEVPIDGRSVIDMELYQDVQVLDEIVVIGYGIQKKRVATGSISKLSSEKLEGFQVQSVQTALEGQVSGLIVNSSSGQPGAGKSLLIRGVSTNGDNSPLYVVDGLQVSGIDNINPEDIESVDVLKDAASSAIYGARAANGVVIITTKKGGDTGKITYEGFTSRSRPWKLPEMLSADDYILVTREKFANGNQTDALNSLGFPQLGQETFNTNWMDQIFDDATLQSHRLTASAQNLYLSLEYWDEKGVVGGDKSNYKRYAARINGTKELNEYVTFGENLYINRVDNQTIGVNDAFGTVIADAFAYDPITDVFNTEKQYGFEQSNWVQKEYVNPLSRLFLADNEGHSDQIVGNIYAEIKPMEGLTFRSDFGMDYSWFKFRSFTPDYKYHSAFVNVNNDVAQGYGFFQTFQVENYATYTKQIDRHDFNFVLGTSYRESISENAGGSTSNIPDEVKFDDNWQNINAGQDSLDLSYGGVGVDYRLISYYGRLIYSLDNKYLFTATLRRDGSSNFGEANRFGIFPSFSAGWIISDEDFFDVGPVSFMKLRASWGVNGNDRIAPLAYASTIENVFTYPFGINQSLNTGASLATPPNPNIKWEESVQFDIGLEVRLWEDRLSAEFDYYKKNTKDLLMNQIIPGFIGATNNPISNLGEIQNTGFEMALNYKVNLGELRLRTTLNYTTFKNKVVRVAGDSGFLTGWSWPVRNTPITRMTEGFPVGHFVGYRTDGIFQNAEEVFSHLAPNGDVLQPRAEPGDIRYVDVSGDGVINSDDITDIGSPWPDHIVGLSVGADYKGFDFNVVLSTQIGHDIFRAYERSDITYTNYQTFWLDRWTPENTDTTYPRLVSNDPNNNQRPSDFYLEDGTFLRLRNLQLGYNLPQNLVAKAKLQALRVYLSANNLITLTNYNGFDPEIGTTGWILDTGIDKGYYPSNKTIGFGLKITM
ncbi:MAG: TonB-dependent receptor [Saprospiraceae bacterium]|nr:TonB-dependent receptor [Bacteroidia bacterium]NNK90716.1 TonB-dependent receptor [Saprospiraceae bacterium]